MSAETKPSSDIEGFSKLHEQLFQEGKGRGLLKLSGDENDVFLVYGPTACRQIMEDHENFSSNPFQDKRLVALNTMKKTQHDKLIKYVNSGYSTSRVKQVEFLLKKILHKHTVNFDGNLYRMTTRFHMEVSRIISGLVEYSDDHDYDLSWHSCSWCPVY